MTIPTILSKLNALGARIDALPIELTPDDTQGYEEAQKEMTALVSEIMLVPLEERQALAKPMEHLRDKLQERHLLMKERLEELRAQMEEARSHQQAARLYTLQAQKQTSEP